MYTSGSDASGPEIQSAAWVSFKAYSAQRNFSCINGNPLPTLTLHFLLYFNTWYLQETKSYFTALVSKSWPPVFPLKPASFFSYLESTFLLCLVRTDDLTCTSLWNTFYSQVGSLWSSLHLSFLKRHVFPPRPHCPCFWDDVSVLSSALSSVLSRVMPAFHQCGSDSALDSQVFISSTPFSSLHFLVKKKQYKHHLDI